MVPVRAGVAPEVSFDLTDRQTDRQIHTDDYSNPRCACAPRVNKCVRTKGITYTN